MSAARYAAAMLLAGGAVLAQEPVNMTAATQPSPGHAVAREQLRYWKAPGIDEVVADTSIVVGLRHDLSLSLNAPVRWRGEDRPGAGRDDDVELGDARALVKWRVHRHDSGPIDTERASVIAGAQLDTGSGRWLRPGSSDDAYSPVAGAVYTKVAGRHGVNAGVEATLNTGRGPNKARWDGSYLFRLAPAAYDAASTGAAYAVLELNGTSEGNGDHELLIAPGFMYEARLWTFEASVLLPLFQDLEHRPEIDVGVVIGLRLSF
jgi:hypothetical protein